jgi:NitT/TauT family transport system substrate-binding protein
MRWRGAARTTASRRETRNDGIFCWYKNNDREREMKLRTNLMLAAALGLAILSRGHPAAADDAINCTYPFWPGFAPVNLADQLGYFREEGLTVNEAFDDDRVNVLPALERGDIQCDMRTVGEHQGRPRTPETQGTIIGTIDVSLGGDGVVADGTIKNAGDLKGKIFAVEPNVPARLLAQMELKKYGLTLKDLQVKDIASADAIAIFADPSVPAVATYEPTLSQALKASNKPGAHILVSSNDYPGLITDVIVARTDDLKKNPEEYKKFLRGIYRAIDYFNAHHDDAVKIMAPHFLDRRRNLSGRAQEPEIYTLRAGRRVPRPGRPARQAARPVRYGHGAEPRKRRRRGEARFQPANRQFDHHRAVQGPHALSLGDRHDRERAVTDAILDRCGGGLEARLHDGRGAERRTAARGLASARELPRQHESGCRSLCGHRQLRRVAGVVGRRQRF